MTRTSFNPVTAAKTGFTSRLEHHDFVPAKRDGVNVTVTIKGSSMPLLTNQLKPAELTALAGMKDGDSLRLSGEVVSAGKKTKQPSFLASSLEVNPARPEFVKGERVRLSDAAVHRDGATLRLGSGPDAPELLVSDLRGKDFEAINQIGKQATVDLEGVWVNVGKKTQQRAFLATSVSVDGPQGWGPR